MTRITAAEARALREGVCIDPLVEHASTRVYRQLWRDDAGDLKFVAQINEIGGAYLDLFAASPRLAAEVEALSAELAALRFEHEAHAALLAATRADRDEARAKIAAIYTAAFNASEDYPDTETLCQQVAHHALIDVLYSQAFTAEYAAAGEPK